MSKKFFTILFFSIILCLFGCSENQLSKDTNEEDGSMKTDQNITDSYTEEDFLNYLNDKLDYYKESGDYIDETISEPETLNAGQREYKKVTLRYTYSASNGSFIMPYQSDYYYTLIEDDEVYYVEVSNEDGIITQDELNTFLTIDVE